MPSTHFLVVLPRLCALKLQGENFLNQKRDAPCCTRTQSHVKKGFGLKQLRPSHAELGAERSCFQYEEEKDANQPVDATMQTK